jgi:uncharacterized membrane protein YfcA
VSALQALLILLAGVGAGTINTIVGSGTLVTFPTLLFFGYPPLTANISNNVGLVAGGATGSWAYRNEMVGGGGAIRRLAPMSVLGSLVGATLLLVLPASAFATIVPVLIAVSLVLVLAGPRLQARVQAPHETHNGHGALMVGVFVAGIYGGYFGAAQGVLLMGIFSLLTDEGLQRLNGYKNVLATLVNFVAAVIFLAVAREHVDWAVAGLIAVGAVIGGLVGATIGRRLPPTVLRAVIVVVGVAAIVRMLASR